MYQFLNKYGQAAAFGLGALITVLFFVQIRSGINTFEGLSKADQLQSGIFSFGLGAAVIMVVVCTIAAIAFGFYFLITHPKAIVKSVGPFVVLLVIFGISYAMSKPASSGPLVAVVERFELTNGQEKFVSAGLTTTLILFFSAAAAFAVSEIRNFFK